MINIFKSIREILIVVLILAIVGMFIFPPKNQDPDPSEYIKIGGKEYKVLEDKQDTVFLAKKFNVPEYVPTPAEKIYVDVPSEIDSAKVVEEYYSKTVVKDSIVIDSLGTAFITDTISANKILSRKATFEYTYPIIMNTRTVLEPPKNQVYFGGGVGFDKTNFINQIKGGLLLKTKRDKIFGLHVGLSNTPLSPNSMTPFVEGTLYWKIKLRRK